MISVRQFGAVHSSEASFVNKFRVYIWKVPRMVGTVSASNYGCFGCGLCSVKSGWVFRSRFLPELAQRIISQRVRSPHLPPRISKRWLNAHHR